MSAPKKPKRIRAFLGWGDPAFPANVAENLLHARFLAGPSKDHVCKLAVLDVSDPEALIGQVARSLCKSWNGDWSKSCEREQFSFDARCALESIGIVSKRRAKR